MRSSAKNADGPDRADGAGAAGQPAARGCCNAGRRGVSLRARARRHLGRTSARATAPRRSARCAILSGYFRGDHVRRPARRGCAMAPIDAALGWCEVPDDRNYNRPVKIPYGASHETHAPRRPALRCLPGARLEHLAAPARPRQRHLLPPGAAGLHADARLRGGDGEGDGAAAAAICRDRTVLQVVR